MTDRCTTLVIVDDDPIVRRAMLGALSRCQGVRGIALSNGQEAVAHASRGPADAYLIDVSMPVMDGISTVITLRAMGVTSRIVLLTALAAGNFADVATTAGADGFLVKTAPLRDVIHAVLGDDVDIPWVLPEPRVKAAADAELNDRELVILRLLCQARSNAEIAKELHLAESTVKSYVGSILRKMGVDSRLQAVVKAFRAGIGQI